MLEMIKGILEVLRVVTKLTPDFGFDDAIAGAMNVVIDRFKDFAMSKIQSELGLNKVFNVLDAVQNGKVPKIDFTPKEVKQINNAIGRLESLEKKIEWLGQNTGDFSLDTLLATVEEIVEKKIGQQGGVTWDAFSRNLSNEQEEKLQWYRENSSQIPQALQDMFDGSPVSQFESEVLLEIM